MNALALHSVKKNLNEQIAKLNAKLEEQQAVIVRLDQDLGSVKKNQGQGTSDVFSKDQTDNNLKAQIAELKVIVESEKQMRIKSDQGIQILKRELEQEKISNSNFKTRFDEVLVKIVDSLQMYANYSLDADNFEDASRLFSEALIFETAYRQDKRVIALLWSKKGDCYFGMKNYEEAMNCVTVSIENDPKNAFYYYDCAYKYYYGLKNVNAAKKYAKEALKLNSNHEKTKELLLKIESMKIN